ncbi:hypothetical protein NDU88_003599 [Pleurodeles waltl]|uniref:Uncharacterized protein n=1 Tax=Pleurodeles waltl TaxID=8319 RepID=A0AAV7KYY8_PLEWA|nr:hypothetical protein NDU88_003599 [Pleurodeles waltl]
MKGGRRPAPAIQQRATIQGRAPHTGERGRGEEHKSAPLPASNAGPSPQHLGGRPSPRLTSAQFFPVIQSPAAARLLPRRGRQMGVHWLLQCPRRPCVSCRGEAPTCSPESRARAASDRCSTRARAADRRNLLPSASLCPGGGGGSRAIAPGSSPAGPNRGPPLAVRHAASRRTKAPRQGARVCPSHCGAPAFSNPHRGLTLRLPS